MASATVEPAGRMTRGWVRFQLRGQPRYGPLNGERITVCHGDPFAGADPADDEVALAEVRILPP